MRAFDMRSTSERANLCRNAHFLFVCGLIVFYAATTRAAIVSSGDVTPDPNTTTNNTVFYIGQGALGSMTVDGGSIVASGTSYIGDNVGATGTATITGNGSTWNSRNLTVGRDGSGNLTISAGGTVNTSLSGTVGDNPGSTGTVEVIGAGSGWNVSSILTVGDRGSGSLTIADGGLVSSSTGRVGGFQGNGSVTVTGSGSHWTNSSSLTVGDSDLGTLDISDGGTVTNRGGTIGDDNDALGTVTVTGANSAWLNTGDLSVGGSGSGTLNISGGGRTEVAQETFVGRFAMSEGTINFDNGTLTTGGLLADFSDLHGTGVIQTHGLVADIDLVIDQNNGPERQLTLDSEPDQNITINLDMTAAGSLGAGYRGAGTLTITDGLSVASRNGYLGYHDEAAGQATIDGSNSNWNIANDLHVGYQGAGTLTIAGGAAVDVGRSTFVGRSSAGSVHFDNGTLTTKSLWAAPDQLHGAGTIHTNGLVGDLNLTFDDDHPAQQQFVLNSEPDQNVTINLNADGSGAIGVGYRAQASLSISGGVTVRSNAGYLGIQNGSVGTATVTGEDTAWVIGGELNVGQSGSTGELTIAGGAAVSNTSGRIGNATVTVTGDGSLWTNSSTLGISGFNQTARLIISEGGRVVSGIQPGGVPFENGIGVSFATNGEVSVEGPGSSWEHRNSLVVGGDGNGVLTINGGGHVTSAGGVIANGSFSPFPAASAATVTGAGSEWISTGSLTVGNGRTASLTISDGARVTSTDGFLGAAFGSSGIATVTLSGENSVWEIGSRLAVGGGSFTGGGAAMMTIQNGATARVGQLTTIFPQGVLKLDGGTFTSPEIRLNFPGGGQFQWTSGTLHVGRYRGSLTNSAGILAPGEPTGITTITGSYTQQAAAKLEIEIAGIDNTQYDAVSVMGTASLGGQLELALIDGFVPDQQHIFTVFGAAVNPTGTFENIASGQRLFTTDGAGSFLVHYGAGSAFNARQIVLTNFQSSTLAGDFNRDGSVDAADYVVWRRNPSGNAFVDTTNYQTWRANFGRAAEQLVESTNVPEPAAFALIGTMLIAALFFTRRRPS
jgi:T5SS/PEP-CTERM-associated repeat protein